MSWLAVAEYTGGVGAVLTVAAGCARYRPLYRLECRLHPGYRFRPPRYPEPHIYNQSDAQKRFSVLCKEYEGDMVRMGSDPDPAEVARAVAEQMGLPYRYGHDRDGVWGTEVYLDGHPSRRFMESGTAISCSRRREYSFLRDYHWSEAIPSTYQWR